MIKTVVFFFAVFFGGGGGNGSGIPNTGISKSITVNF